MVDTKNLNALRDPMPSKSILWRVGTKNQDGTRGRALPYIDARIVQNRLDDVVGPENWKNSFVEILANNRLAAVRCQLSIRLGDEWVTKEDSAHLDTSADMEAAIKGMYSDALKRAAVQWGIGRYLYEFSAPWVEIDEYGRMLQTPTLPDNLLPECERHAGAAAPKQEAASRDRAERVVDSTVARTQQTSQPAAPVVTATATEQVTAPAAPSPAVVDTAVSTPAVVEAPAPAAAPVEAPAPVVEAPAPVATPVAAPVETQAPVQEVKAQPAPQPAASTADAGDATPFTSAKGTHYLIPGNIQGEQLSFVTDMLSKVDTLKPAMLISYVRGGRGAAKVEAHTREWLLATLEELEAKAG